MNPKDYLNVVVRPNIAEFEEEYGDIRRAYNATAALDSLIAHIHEWCRANAPAELAGVADDSHFRHVLAQRYGNTDLKLLIDVAKCQKHVRLTRGSPALTSSDQVATKSLGWGQARWGEGRWGSPPQVTIEVAPGEFRVLGTVLNEALAVLEGEISRLGI
ncbi:MAG: hypothetical protein KF765_02930 [Parvibaculaceae bacterium]|nr:hypothetical protein [Parvibaculaceae bacterium]